MTKKKAGYQHIKFDVDRELEEEFTRCCEFYETSKAAMMRLMVKEYVAEWKVRYPEVSHPASVPIETRVEN